MTADQKTRLVAWVSGLSGDELVQLGTVLYEQRSPLFPRLYDAVLGIPCCSTCWGRGRIRERVLGSGSVRIVTQRPCPVGCGLRWPILTTDAR